MSLQGWRDLTFLHWPVDVEAVGALLPPGLEVDTYEGSAWVGLTPFVMHRVRAPGLPAVPVLSTFGEVNLRTYVRDGTGGTGIWFLSLDCARLATVAALRLLGLPYFWAAVRLTRTGRRISYQARRRGTDVTMDVTVRVGHRLHQQDTLTTFLTGRWSGYTRRAGRLWRVPVEHEPWPLHRATAESDVAGLPEAAGLPPVGGQPLVHFSPGVRTRLGAPRPV
ncbi:DUF2071 domain-containing protein [Georgenia sp. 10Sc9-8]|uniref:DUF2071 domain-containing protein n=1 Tax=Georgenia halotolerans TaxID=3028317 RepID=A0ABT5TWQ1_9MICO|nr:DUF2071 domain-containing protein [Georgenia halotolerans]